MSSNLKTTQTLSTLMDRSEPVSRRSWRWWWYAHCVGPCGERWGRKDHQDFKKTLSKGLEDHQGWSRIYSEFFGILSTFFKNKDRRKITPREQIWVQNTLRGNFCNKGPHIGQKRTTYINMRSHTARGAVTLSGTAWSRSGIRSKAQAIEENFVPGSSGRPHVER